MARAVVVTSEHVDWALKRPGTLLVLVGKEMDCARAAHQNASGLAVVLRNDVLVTRDLAELVGACAAADALCVSAARRQAL